MSLSSHVCPVAKFGYIIFCYAIFVQAVIWLVVSMMDELGFFPDIQWIMLEYARSIYIIPISIFVRLVPDAWLTFGNVLAGFAAIGFGVVFYSFCAGVVGFVFGMIAGPQVIRARKGPGNH